jgi:sulfur carrier protein
MHIEVNGRTEEIEPGATVAALLDALNLDRRYLAVERNLQLVPREQHPSTVLEEGDKLEVVTLVGGG